MPKQTLTESSVDILFIEQLSTMIGKTPTTIRTFHSNPQYRHLIPTPFKMPGSRRLCWLREDVLKWIRGGAVSWELAPARSRGRPTKREQLARAKGKQAQQQSQ